MQNCNQISILGNDMRMDYVAQCLFDKGFEINKDIQKIHESNIIILEPNMKFDFEKLVDCLKPGTKIFLAKKNLIFEKLCEKKNLMLYEYMSSTNIICENAKLTALGIMKEAKKHNVIFEESNCLVSGFGNCGKAIAKELRLNKANVDIFVRRNDLNRSIEELGCSYLNISNWETITFEKYSYVFNTIPAMIFTSKILCKLPSNVLIFDIASMPGGVDFHYCDLKGIEYYHCLGIPGKMYPKDAGFLIAEEINNILFNESDPICN